MRNCFLLALFTVFVLTIACDLNAQSVKITRSALKGIGAETGVMRRDPSDIIKVGDLYYVWYSKGKISPGYDATVWYGSNKGVRILIGKVGSVR